MKEQITIDDLNVEVRRSNRRKTLNLTVDRGGQLVVIVPSKVCDEVVEKYLSQKKLWMYKTLIRKEEVLHPQPSKEYVSGEGFYYMGRKYRLKVFEAGDDKQNTPPLQLKEGRFRLRRDAADAGRGHFINWYSHHGGLVISEKVKLLKERVAASPRDVKVCDLRFRWASCTPKGRLHFHWRVILLPREYIDYLILHELVHLREHHHGPEFYRILRRACPSYEEREEWLELNGDRYFL